MTYGKVIKSSCESENLLTVIVMLAEDVIDVRLLSELLANHRVVIVCVVRLPSQKCRVRRAGLGALAPGRRGRAGGFLRQWRERRTAGRYTGARQPQNHPDALTFRGHRRTQRPSKPIHVTC